MRILRPAVLVVLLALLGGGAAPAQIIDRVLASVGGRIVTASDVRAARELGLVTAGGPAAGQPRAILERLIDRQLILDEVERYAPPEPREADVRREYEAMRSRFPSPGAFESAMRSAGMDEALLLQWVRNDLRIRSYLDQRFVGVIEPSPADLEQYVRRVRARPGAGGLSDAEVLPQARALAVAERREALVREWIEGLRRRASISYTAGDL